jgi:hypothetical protein
MTYFRITVFLESFHHLTNNGFSSAPLGTFVERNSLCFSSTKVACSCTGLSNIGLIKRPWALLQRTEVKTNRTSSHQNVTCSRVGSRIFTDVIEQQPVTSCTGLSNIGLIKRHVAHSYLFPEDTSFNGINTCWS